MKHQNNVQQKKNYINKYTYQDTHLLILPLFLRIEFIFEYIFRPFFINKNCCIIYSFLWKFNIGYIYTHTHINDTSNDDNNYIGNSGIWCLRMWGLKIIVCWPSTTEVAGTSHLKPRWARGLKLLVFWNLTSWNTTSLNTRSKRAEERVRRPGREAERGGCE